MLITASDSQKFLAHVNTVIGKKLDVLDWSTNCNNSTNRLVENEYQFADYILTSDLTRGGFIVGDFTGNYEYMRPESDLGRYYKAGVSIREAVMAMADAERSFWDAPPPRNDMTANRIKQSLSVLDTAKYAALSNSIDWNKVPTGDVLNYIRSFRPDLEQRYYDFRFHYVSNKSFFSWDEDSNGFRKVD